MRPLPSAPRGGAGRPGDDVLQAAGRSEQGAAGAAGNGVSATEDGGEPEYDGYQHTKHEPVRPETRGEVGPLIAALHDIFERDRGVASQGATARCGICYLHYPLAELRYREEEGLYVCPTCSQALGHAQVFMVRRQQK